jgi:hypothetical protein
VLEELAGFPEERLADGSEADGMGLPFEQGLSDFVFQGLDLALKAGWVRKILFAARLMFPSSATATK